MTILHSASAIRAASTKQSGCGEETAEMVEFPTRSMVTETDFKTAMRQVAASVAIVTARSGQVRNGLTATAVCSVTASPPTMLVCINRGASAEALIEESGAFAINFLTDEQHQVARLFSTSKLGPEDRFAEGRWLSLQTGSPILDGCVASFDCQVESRIVAGTHHVYLGRILAVTSLDQEILLYRDGSFRRLAAAG